MPSDAATVAFNGDASETSPCRPRGHSIRTARSPEGDGVARAFRRGNRDPRPALVPAGRPAGQSHRRQLAEHLQLGESQRVVAVGLAFEVLEAPRFAGRVGDLHRQAAFGGEVGGPAGVAARLDDDHRSGVAGEERGEVVAAGVERMEGRGTGKVLRG